MPHSHYKLKQLKLSRITEWGLLINQSSSLRPVRRRASGDLMKSANWLIVVF